jgi:hypothetical protein
MGNERQERRLERNVVIAWIAWVLSLFLPAVVFRGSELGLLRGDIAFPGWQAAVITVMNPEQVERGAFRFVLRLMGFTNIVLALSPVTLVRRRRVVQNAFMFAAVGAACVDALALIEFGWLVSYGYFVWLASFVTLALTLSRDRAAPRPF